MVRFKINNAKRCPYCFARWLKNTKFCPLCLQMHTHRPSLQQRSPLAPGYLLMQRYRLGIVIDASSQSLLYAAWDEKRGRRLIVREFFPVTQARRAEDGCTLIFDAVQEPEKLHLSKAILCNGTFYFPERNRIDKLVYNRNVKGLMEDEPVYQACMRSIQGTRNRQEDMAACLSGCGFAFGILCDGMGGMGNGEIASKYCVERFYALYPKLCTVPEEEILPLLIRTARETDMEVYELRNTEGDRMRCGTTLVCAVLRGNRLYYFHLGDSRLYRIRNEKIEQLTQDHTLYQDLLEKVARGEITSQQADAHPKRDALTQYIGSGLVDCVTVYTPLTLAPGDRILLCSDGVYRTLCEEQILKVLLNQANLEDAATQLLTIIGDKKIPNQDNATVILLKGIGGEIV